MSESLLITGIGSLARMPEGADPPSGSAQGDLGLVPDAALLIADGRVDRAGPRAEVERGVPAGTPRLDVEGRAVLPGWVDAHTHLLFGGTREDEFARRIAGEDYEQIAAAGGGIQASVRQFREASDEAIMTRGRRNLELALAHGTTTIEVKSGYGLDPDQEIRALRLIAKLGTLTPIDVVPTFLGAHEFPAEFRERREAYVDLVVERMIPAVVQESLAVFCDVFCERGVFTPDESRRILTTARTHGLRLKVHADEFGDTGGSRIAAELKAVSADHLHATPPEGIERLVRAGVVGVLLPGTSFFLNLPSKAPARDMVAAGLPLAVATDMNPGSSMSQSMPLMTTLACLTLRLSPEEALVAATTGGAAALGLEGDRGRLRPGYRGDFQVLDLPDPRLVPYHYGISHVRAVFREGRQVWGPPLVTA